MLFQAISSLILFLGIVFLGDGLKLPSYIKACSRLDPNINQCALKSARAAIPHFVKGDKKYDIPNLSPLFIQKIEMNHGTGPVGLKMVGENVKWYGLDKTEVKDIKITIKDKTFEWYLFTPIIHSIANYNVSGRILLLPIQGNGRINITMVNFNYHFKYWYELEKSKQDGMEHFKIIDNKIDYNLTRMHVKINGLFNGNKFLEDEMNKFLNENWEDVVKELGPTIAETVAQIAATILNSIAKHVPYDYAYPEKA